MAVRPGNETDQPVTRQAMPGQDAGSIRHAALRPWSLARRRLVAGGCLGGRFALGIAGRLAGLRLVVELVGPRRHDDVACLGVVLKPVLGQQRDELVTVEIGKIVE